jgi:hypothetical protein
MINNSPSLEIASHVHSMWLGSSLGFILFFANHLVTRLGVVLSLNRSSSEQISAKANFTHQSLLTYSAGTVRKEFATFCNNCLVLGFLKAGRPFTGVEARIA